MLLRGKRVTMSLPLTGAGPSAAGGAAVPWYLSGGILAANCVAAYQPKGAASLAASYVNLANPGTYDAALGVAPTWAAGTGWTFNGSTQWLDTGIVPAGGYSMLVQFANAVGAGNHGHGVYAAAGQRFYVRPRSGGVSRIYGYGDTGQVIAGAPAAGNMAIAGPQGYLNGVADGGAPGAWVATVLSIAIGAENGIGLPIGNWFQGDVIAAAVYNSTLTAPQVAAVAAAMAAL